jgi:GNAT superfamily N-acetyltransferase
MSSLEIRRLTPSLAPDYLGLLDAAFAENPDWSGCYCLYYHSDEEPWDAGPGTAARHRAERAEQLARGDVPGYLAYLDGRAVGWLNAGPRETYRCLRGLPDAAPDEALVMCFVVLPGARRQGVASALLDFALQDLKARGMAAVQAYPPVHSPAPERWTALSYKGPLSMYLERGFELVQREGRQVARRAL